MTRRAVIGLGANLGAPLRTLTEAAERIGRVAPVSRYSRIYRTGAVGCGKQPDFFNAAVLVATADAPWVLMAALLDIERALGRRRLRRRGPRTIDLDLLWVEGVRLARVDVTLPHPRLLQRAFALLPLCEVAPGAREPFSGRPYACLLGAVAGQSVHAVAAGLPWGCAVPSMDTGPRGW